MYLPLLNGRSSPYYTWSHVRRRRNGNLLRDIQTEAKAEKIAMSPHSPLTDCANPDTMCISRTFSRLSLEVTEIF
jgi:hypothetical protein